MIGALLLLSSVTGIFNNLVVVVEDASAQQYDYYSEYPTEEYKYECRTGPFEGFFVSSVEFCKHIKFDDKDRKDRDRDNRTGTQGPPGPQGQATRPTRPSRRSDRPTRPTRSTSAQGSPGTDGTDGINGLQGPQGIPGPQGPAGPVDLFVCTSGPLTGKNVTDPLLCEAPNDANVCPALTDLEGVYANNTDTDCNIFATCAFNSPLGISLNLTASQSVEVADAQLCELSVPGVEVCTSGPMAGAVVTDPLLCEAPNDANVCPALTDLEGVYANNTDTDCNIFATCAFNSPLGISLNLTASQSVEVADAQLCELSVPGVEVCTFRSNGRCCSN